MMCAACGGPMHRPVAGCVRPRESDGPRRAPIGADGAVIEVGGRVTVSDPWGPSGVGAVLELQTTPHHAVLVHLDGAARAQWILGPHVRPLETVAP